MRTLIRIIFVIFIANEIDCLGKVYDNCCDCFKEKDDEKKDEKKDEEEEEKERIRKEEEEKERIRKEEEEKKRQEEEEKERIIKEEEEKERIRKEEEKKREEEEKKRQEEEEKKRQEEERKKKEEEENERIKKNNKLKLIKNRYKLLEENIDKGGYGTVSKYYDTTDNKTVAIKIISPKHRGNQEYEILDLLLKNKPNVNIVEIKDIFEDDKDMFFVEEFCKYNLFTYYKAHKDTEEKYSFTDEERMCLFYQLINGLEFLHKLDIAHRDLKIFNLLVTEEGILKICDFGVCYHCYQKGKYISSRIGTPGCMAPETYNWEKHDPFKADIWSCGLILWAMFNDHNIIKFPITGSEITTYDDYYEKYKNIKIDDLKNCENELCKDLVFKMLTFDPKKRISIDEIKKHELYIKGKKKFIEKYPEKFKEIDDKII